MASPSPLWRRLVRFVPASNPKIELIGQPVESLIDVGQTIRDGRTFEVAVFEGSSVLEPGNPSGAIETAVKLLSPVKQSEIGTVRGIALNYYSHAEHTGLTIPKAPMMFMKPSTAITGPYPDPAIIPKAGAHLDAADYESELAVVIGKPVKNATRENAMEHVYGYMAANDISSRTIQWEEKQWCRSKGFDGSCPLGPCIVTRDAMPEWDQATIKGTWNGDVVQESKLDDFIFDIPALIVFLSESTTLPTGTVILTGTPMGVGFSSKPPQFLKAGDEFAVTIEPLIGTLTNIFENESS